MKGLELPLSTIVIIAMVLIVLLGIVALWISGFGGGATAISVEAAKSAGCGRLMRDIRTCSAVDPYGEIPFDGSVPGVPKFDVNKDGLFCSVIASVPPAVGPCAGQPTDTLQTLCETYYGISPTDAQRFSQCRKVCGCGG